MSAVAVALAGAGGAVARALIDALAAGRTRRALPWGTFVVNVTGSLAAGFALGLFLYHGFDGETRTVLTVGFLGAYTTLSTHAFEVVALARGRHTVLATAYAVGSATAALGAATAGLAAAAAI